MDRFGGFYELMFRGVMCQFRKSYTSAEIHLVDVEVLSFDLRSCTALFGEVSYKSNRNLVLDALTVGLPHGTEEQHPKFHPDCVFLSLANLVDVSVPFRVSP
jgi:hypothetical protein